MKQKDVQNKIQKDVQNRIVIPKTARAKARGQKKKQIFQLSWESLKVTPDL